MTVIKQRDKVGSDIEILSWDNFKSLPPYELNRAVDPRIDKVAGVLLNTPLPTHNEVCLFQYSNGHREVANGNTRQAVWKKWEQGGNGETKFIPNQVRATIYHVLGEEDSKQIYYSLDSTYSVEKTADKVTGVYRKNLVNFQNVVFQKAKITKALEFASKYHSNNPKHMPLNNDNIQLIVEGFLPTLKKIDQNFRIGQNHEIFKQAVLAAILMMVRKHGLTNQIRVGIKRLLKRSVIKDGTSKWDGITHILEEMMLGTNPGGELGAGRGSSDSTMLPMAIDFVLYHFEKFLEGKTYSRGRAGWTFIRAKKNRKGELVYKDNQTYKDFWK